MTAATSFSTVCSICSMWVMMTRSQSCHLDCHQLFQCVLNMQHVGEDDEISELSSGLGASTVDSKHHEQDLAGFPEVEHSRDSALSAVAEGFEAAGPPLQSSMVHSPVKTAGSEHSAEAQGIGTSVHPSRHDLHLVRLAVIMKENAALLDAALLGGMYSKQMDPSLVLFTSINMLRQKSFSLQHVCMTVNRRPLTISLSCNIQEVRVEHISVSAMVGNKLFFCFTT